MAPVLDHFDRYLVELNLTPPPEAAVRRLAVDKVLEAYVDDKLNWRAWGDARRDVAKEQLTYLWTGIDIGEIDGLVGPSTRAARDAYAYWRNNGALPAWRDSTEPDDAPLDLPARGNFPNSSDAALIAFYGQPSQMSNLVKVPCPWKLRIAWSLSQTRSFLWSHKKCADPLGEVLESVHAHYGDKAIRALGLDIFSGDYNPRRMRGGSRWSKHAWGIAWDFYDVKNQLPWDHTRALFAKSEYEDWWRIWEAGGFTSLGRAKDYDWMHIQATSNA